MTGDVELLLPPDELRGWSGLQGHMRFSYHHRTDERNSAKIAVFLEGAGMSVVNGDPRKLVVSALRFSTFLAVRVRASQQHIRWVRERRTSHDRYMFIFVRHGELAIDGDAERHQMIDAGVCIVFPGDAPVDFRVDGASELIIFTFDRQEILPMILTRDSVGNTEAVTAIAPIYAFLESVTQSPRFSAMEESASFILRGLLRDVARALSQSVLATTRAADGLFERAQAVIGARHADPTFTVDELAEACGVSRRTLDRVYTAAGRSVAREVRQARARLARRNLATEGRISLEGIAAASGFRTVATMNRAIRETYGIGASTSKGNQTPDPGD